MKLSPPAVPDVLPNAKDFTGEEAALRGRKSSAPNPALIPALFPNFPTKLGDVAAECEDIVSWTAHAALPCPPAPQPARVGPAVPKGPVDFGSVNAAARGDVLETGDACLGGGGVDEGRTGREVEEGGCGE